MNHAQPIEVSEQSHTKQAQDSASDAGQSANQSNEKKAGSGTDEIMTLDKVLGTGRTTLGLHVSSKKRLLEEMALLLCRDEPRLSNEDVFRALLERERLGPTGLGNGIALPHGRVKGVDKAIGALATLKTGLAYESPDDQPVTLCISLIVPIEATDAHVKLLADIAERLSDEQRLTALHAASCPDDLVSIMTSTFS